MQLFSDHFDVKAPSVLAWLLDLDPWIFLVPCSLFLVPLRNYFLENVINKAESCISIRSLPLIW